MNSYAMNESVKIYRSVIQLQYSYIYTCYLVSGLSEPGQAYVPPLCDAVEGFQKLIDVSYLPLFAWV